jgi:hypothetical protein
MKHAKPTTKAARYTVMGTPRKAPSIGALAGSTGTPVFAGRLVSQERRPEMAGRNLFTTFDNIIANACIVGASVRYFQSLVGGTSWSVAPKEGGGANAERAADIVREGLFGATMTLPWASIVKKAALYKYYGFSIHEWCARRRKDGMVVFKDIEHRPQHTIDIWDIPDGGGPFRGVVQHCFGQPQLYYVPRNRMLYCVDNTLTDSPDGVGLLRHVSEHARRLARYEQLEGFGYEGDLRGMPVGRVPGSELAKIAATENKPEGWIDQQVEPIHRLVNNHIKTPFQGIVLDSAVYTSDQLGSMNPTVSSVPKWAVDIIKGTSTGLGEINTVIERINREIARVLGMEFLLLGGDGKGSLALSRDKTSMFAAVLEATLSELSWFATHDLVYPLLELNGLDPEECAPQVNPDPIATERIEAVVDALEGLARAGAVLQPDDPAIDQVRARLHLAKQPELAPDLIGAINRQRAGISNEEPDDGGDPDGGDGGGGGGLGGEKPTGKDVENEARPRSQEADKPKKRGTKKALFRHLDDDK